MSSTPQIYEFDSTLHLDKYDTIIFDIDGVLCRNHKFISGIPEVITKLVKIHNKKVILCTNNSTKHHSFYFKLFKEANLPLEEDCLYTSASTMASYLQFKLEGIINDPSNPNPNAKILLIGEQGLFDECNERNISIIEREGEGNDDNTIENDEKLTKLTKSEKTEKDEKFEKSEKTKNDEKLAKSETTSSNTCPKTTTSSSTKTTTTSLSNHIVTLSSMKSGIKSLQDLVELKIDPNISVIGLGLSMQWDYVDCALVEVIIQDNNPLLIATSRVMTTTVSPERQLPAVGTIVNMIEKSIPINNHGKIDSRKNTKFIAMGKPERYMFDAICRDNNVTNGSGSITKERTLMVGDRLDSDVLFGQRCGIDTLLVFSGVNNKDVYYQHHGDKIIGSDGKGVKDMDKINDERKETDGDVKNDELIIMDLNVKNDELIMDLNVKNDDELIMDLNAKSCFTTVFPTYCGDDITVLLSGRQDMQ